MGFALPLGVPFSADSGMAFFRQVLQIGQSNHSKSSSSDKRDGTSCLNDLNFSG